mgnify:CR=1 FL=1
MEIPLHRSIVIIYPYSFRLSCARLSIRPFVLYGTKWLLDVILACTKHRTLHITVLAKLVTLWYKTTDLISWRMLCVSWGFMLCSNFGNSVRPKPSQNGDE